MAGETQKQLTSLDAAVVKLTGNQTVGGVKTFTSEIKGSTLTLTGAFSALNGKFNFSDEVNVGMEIGRRDGTAGTPYIDFHTDGKSATDYNVRLLASGSQLRVTAMSGLQLNGGTIMYDASSQTFTI